MLSVWSASKWLPLNCRSLLMWSLIMLSLGLRQRFSTFWYLREHFSAKKYFVYSWMNTNKFCEHLPVTKLKSCLFSFYLLPYLEHNMNNKKIKTNQIMSSRFLAEKSEKVYKFYFFGLILLSHDKLLNQIMIIFQKVNLI